jgi:hypothetical protein
MNHHKISKIISGGQTGADRAGIDVAIYGLIMGVQFLLEEEPGRAHFP